jgi:hypothetical protein
MPPAPRRDSPKNRTFVHAVQPRSLRGAQCQERLLRPSLRFRRARHAAESSLNFLSVAHRHCRRFPTSRLHHGRQINVERQHILRRPDPDRVPTDLPHFFCRHPHEFSNPLECLCDRIDLEPRPNLPSPNQPPKHRSSFDSRRPQPHSKVRHRIRRQIQGCLPKRAKSSGFLWIVRRE